MSIASIDRRCRVPTVAFDADRLFEDRSARISKSTHLLLRTDQGTSHIKCPANFARKTSPKNKAMTMLSIRRRSVALRAVGRRTGKGKRRIQARRRRQRIKNPLRQLTLPTVLHRIIIIIIITVLHRRPPDFSERFLRKFVATIDFRFLLLQSISS